MGLRVEREGANPAQTRVSRQGNRHGRFRLIPEQPRRTGTARAHGQL